MGLIRKSLMITSAGLVSGSSKKQRVAAAQLKELKAQTRLLQELANPAPEASPRPAFKPVPEGGADRTAVILGLLVLAVAIAIVVLTGMQPAG